VSTAVDPNLNPVIVAGGGGGGAPSGPAGGDLAGTYPNPTVGDLTITSEARGDLVRRSASAWGRLPAAPADTFVGGDGTDVVARTVAQVLASLYPRSVDTIPSTAPWSTRNGEGAYAGPATVNVGGTVDFSCVAASSNVLSAAGRAPWITAATFVGMCRISALVGAGASDNIIVFVTDSLATQTTLSGVQITGTNSCSLLRESGSIAGSQTVASITGGQGWAIVVANGADVAAYVGVGSGGNPPADSAWTYLGTVARGASLAVPWAIFGVQLNRDAGSGDVSATAQTFTYGTAP